MTRQAAVNAGIFVLLTLAPAISAGDEVFRCGGALISTETTVAELLSKCGEPSSRKVSTEDVRSHVAKGGTEKLGTTTVETWRYERASGTAPIVVTIADGKIESIERGQ